MNIFTSWFIHIAACDIWALFGLGYYEEGFSDISLNVPWEGGCDLGKYDTKLINSFPKQSSVSKLLRTGVALYPANTCHCPWF